MPGHIRRPRCFRRNLHERAWTIARRELSRYPRRFLPWQDGTYRAFDSARDVIYPHLIWEFGHSRWKGAKEGGERRGGKRSVCSDFNDTERHESGFWLMVLRLHASPTFGRRDLFCQPDYLLFSFFFFQYAGTISTSVSDSRLSFFPYHFRQHSSLSYFYFFRESSPSPFYLLTLVEPADYVTHAL